VGESEAIQMKYNLKNRPKIDSRTRVNQIQMQEWFEGFEAELRQMLDSKEDVQGQPILAVRRFLIKEILGDE